MAAKAGRLCRVKASGAATAFTAEACTATANISYQITNTAKRVWDRATDVTVLNSGTPVDPVADPYTLNRLTGTVLFATATPRTIMVTGDYLPVSTIAEAKSFTFGGAANTVEDTAFGDTDITREVVTRDCSGSISAWRSSDTTFLDALVAAVPVVLEFSTDGGSTIIARAWALLNKLDVSGARTTLQEDAVAFEGAADDDGRSFAFLQ
jgi:hypothetical protein